MKHNGYKIISNLPYIIQYLYSTFKKEMNKSELFREEIEDKTIHMLEWTQSKLRPAVGNFI